MATLRLETDAEGIATLTFDDPAGRVNTMSEAWQADFADAVDQLARDKERIKGVLLASAKTTFFAGAALKEVLQMDPRDTGQVFANIEGIKRSFRKLETFGRPVVALIEGSALGGGWEVALAAHARFARDDSRIQLGLPEVTLGLIPGGTGITKMVRLLGLVAAQPYLIEGRQFSPQEAQELGLVDGLAASPEELRAKARAWLAAHPDALQPWDRKDYRMPGGGPNTSRLAGGLAVATAMLMQKTRGLYPAPQAILEAMVEGALVDYDTAARIESRKLAKVIRTQVARNMITTFFFGLTAIKAGRSRPGEFARWKPAKVGVLGAGMMGAGIAHANAARGIACVMKEVSPEKAQAGMAAIARVTAPQVEKGKMSELDQAALLARITPTTAATDLKGCDLIIEAVFEQRELKAAVTREAEPMLASGGVFASNTSTLPISGLAKASATPERFVGLHFFSPVHKMKLVEIIRGARTSDETVARAYDYVLALGKTPIVVRDSRGFFTSRVFGTFVNEATTMLAEGIPAPLIEHAAIAVGMPVGPLAVMDETALSLSVQVMDQTRADLAAEGKRFETNAGNLLLERMVKELKRPGRAGGGGFYDYPKGEGKHLWPELARLFEKPQGASADVKELGRRMLYRQSVETARCLAEGVLVHVHDGNVGSILAIGFPAWTGGALQYIVSEGVERFFAHADALARQHGPRFALSDDVKQVVAERLAQPAWA
jgi:3-hydroxyacyl-CoA dehydrogenase/enoyl-CoA hydratase/3-hydroxybutyryl-CoA epimerase